MSQRLKDFLSMQIDERSLYFFFCVLISRIKSQSVYEIKDAESLIQTYRTKEDFCQSTIILTGDIDFQNYKNQEILPLCYDNDFNGTFDGQYHSIKNMDYCLTNSSITDKFGLFWVLWVAQFRNVIFEETDYQFGIDESFDFGGSVAGSAWSSAITSPFIFSIPLVPCTFEHFRDRMTSDF